MRRLILLKTKTGLLKKEDITGATDLMCYDYEGNGCEHFIDGDTGTSCGLFGDWFDDSQSNLRLDKCHEAETLASSKGLKTDEAL